MERNLCHYNGSHFELTAMSMMQRCNPLLVVLFAAFMSFGTPHAIAVDANIEHVLTPSPQSDGWPVGNALAAGFDHKAIVSLARALKNNEYSNLHAVVVEHDGKLIYEQYMPGTDERWGMPLGRVNFNRETLHDLRSISKSVTSLLLGIALGSNYNAALKRPILRYLPRYRTDTASGMEKVTLFHVLSMTAGLTWNEMTVPYYSSKNDEIRLYSTFDPIGFVLKRPFREEPGERWYYNSGLTMLVAAAVNKLTKKRLVEFAEQALFEPLQIRNYKWLGETIWPLSGLPSASSGLRLTARDMTKIGSLMLHGGRWQGKQVVPEAWVELSGKRHREDLGAWSDDGIYGYGLQWWHGEFSTAEEPVTAISGVGHGGQRLFVLPEQKLVVSIFSGNYNSTDWWKSERVMKRLVEALK